MRPLIFSRACSCFRSYRLISLSKGRSAPLSAFLADMALPYGILGPVERSHGFHRRMSSACRCRRSGVHHAGPYKASALFFIEQVSEQ
jgi:hypothetical protein